MKVANGRDNVRIEKSKSNPGEWYWKVVTFYGEIFADGESESFDMAVHTASASLSEYQKMNGDES